MVAAARDAFADCGTDSRRTDAILVPRGMWGDRDPGRVVAERLGASRARTTLAEIGVSQLSIVRRACQLIVEGSADIVLVVGGEAKHRADLARRASVELPSPLGADTNPDEALRPDADLMAQAESGRRLNSGPPQYAIIESAIRAAAGRSPADHAAHLGRLWAGFARVAAANPDAWDRSAPSAEAIATPGPRNRTVAAPYTKLMCSRWNVDQSAALVLMSDRAASAVATERYVYPLGIVESNFILTMSRRRDIHRWPAFAVAAERLLSMTGVDVAAIGPVDLYSCFPAAVQAAAAELGLPLDRPFDRPLTVTGGMTFAGGPLNNYVFQAIVTLARRLRSERGAVGLNTAVSGLLTKPALALWSTEQGERQFGWDDVSAGAEAATASIALDADATGTGTVAGYTVLPDPPVVAAVIDVASTRTVAVCDDPATAAAMTDAEHVGAEVRVTAPGVFTS